MKILLVDDEKLIRDVVREYLELDGFLIDEADLFRFAGGSRRRRGYPASFAGFLFYCTADVGRPE